MQVDERDLSWYSFYGTPPTFLLKLITSSSEYGVVPIVHDSVTAWRKNLELDYYGQRRTVPIEGDTFYPPCSSSRLVFPAVT